MRASNYRPFGRGVLIGIVGALAIMATSAAVAQTTGVFQLGQINNVDATSDLRGSGLSPQLRINRAGGGAAATAQSDGTAPTLQVRNRRGIALNLLTPANQPPMRVSSRRLVRGLNADLLDGLHAGDVSRALSTGPRDSTAQVTPNTNVPPGTIDSISVPAGSYLVLASAELFNLASFPFQDNSRTVFCGINWAGEGNPDFTTTLPEGGWDTVSILIPVTLTADGPLALNCKELRGGSDQSFVRVFRYYISALKLVSLN
jgi:hypothetical protein